MSSSRGNWTLSVPEMISCMAVGFLIVATGCSDKSTEPPTIEPSPPTVALTSPIDDDDLSGAVDIAAGATNADEVLFFCDDDQIGTDTTSPYVITWNSGTVTNGLHELSVRATALDGSAEDAIMVTVSNEAGVVVVTVDPQEATVDVGGTQAFEATVTGTSNTEVVWSVDEGVQYGSISGSGVYTAPPARPEPATATVRATSVADPARSASAQVTVRGDAPDVSEAERTLFLAALSGAYEVGDLGIDAVATGAEAVWGASELAGAATTTGTLTQSAPDSDVWTYSASPSDRLVVAYSGGPTLTFVFNVFDGYLDGTWEDFLDAHILDFTVEIPNQLSMRVQSDKHFTGARPSERVRSPEAWTATWERQIDGDVLYEGEWLTVSVYHTGDEEGFVEPGWTGLTTDERFSGTITSALASYTIDQTWWASYLHDGGIGHIVRNWLLKSDSSATLDGHTYKYDSAGARWEANTLLSDPLYVNVVHEPDYWIVSGQLLKDGVAIGQVMFDGPVIIDTHGPELILRLGTGEDVHLHTLIEYP